MIELSFLAKNPSANGQDFYLKSTSGVFYFASAKALNMFNLFLYFPDFITLFA